ncbi:MAG: UDPglucose--hexose-phosphate uridylyltransferase [Actinomycetota bacterium]|jgi:UDPglucose--hexose-1-phosphate uridylyltransferase|nr:UDPglucose--hexose-phosphate uridylyltransferase [Actinomycetota bacterium]
MDAVGDESDQNAAAHELRFDQLSGEWVLLVPHRQGRPNLPQSGCPFCVGGLEAPEPYEVRWFENRWPPLRPGSPIDLPETGDGKRNAAARGAAEVVLFSPDHGASLSTLGVDAVMRVIDLWVERTEALLARPEIEYVLVFENRGAAVGATIHHPHGQIYGYPFVPPAPAREISGSAGTGCAVCAELASEAEDPIRVVFDDGEWMAWVPFASSSSYGLRLAARTHSGRLSDLDDAGRRGLATALSDVLARYDCLWSAPPSEGPFPYLLWFHQAPAHNQGEYHLHAHISPPLRAPGVLRHVASGELGGGLLANPVMPERAAAELRAAARPSGPDRSPDGAAPKP